MTEVRPTSKKSSPRREPVTLDERSWPVNLLILIAAALVGYWIIEARGFDDPRIFHNAWVRLTALLIVTGGLLGSFYWLSNRRVQRMLQLAALVSIGIHVLLVYGLAVQSDHSLSVGQKSDDDSSLVDGGDDKPVDLQYHMTESGDAPSEEPFSEPARTLARDDASNPFQRKEAGQVPLTEPGRAPEDAGEMPAVEPVRVDRAEAEASASRMQPNSPFSKQPLDHPIELEPQALEAPPAPAPAEAPVKVADARPALSRRRRPR